MAGNFVQRVGDTLEAMFGTRKPEITTQTGTYKQTGDQSNLEKIGFVMRKDHLLRNEWGKDMEYTKQLVASEYLIQNEFLVGGDMDEVKAEQEASKKREQDAALSKLEKLREKRDRYNDKIANMEKKLPSELLKG
jgi:hypothetical protein